MATYTVVTQPGYGAPQYGEQQYGGPTPVHHVHHNPQPMINPGCGRRVFSCGDIVFSIRSIIVFWLFVSFLVGCLSVWRVSAFFVFTVDCNNSTSQGLCNFYDSQTFCFKCEGPGECDYAQWCTEQKWIPAQKEQCCMDASCRNVDPGSVFVLCNVGYAYKGKQVDPNPLKTIFLSIILAEAALAALMLVLFIWFVVADTKLYNSHEAQYLVGGVGGLRI